jgi:hypothetical protein
LLYTMQEYPAASHPLPLPALPDAGDSSILTN